jgi:hypothetical protein
MSQCIPVTMPTGFLGGTMRDLFLRQRAGVIPKPACWVTGTTGLADPGTLP